MARTQVSGRIEERRVHPRYHLDLTGTATVISFPLRRRDGERAFDTVSSDVSVGGMKMRTNEPVRLGDRVRVKLHVPGHRGIRLDTLVRWVRRNPRSSRTRFTVGVAFQGHVLHSLIQLLLDMATVPTHATALGAARQVNLPFIRAVEISLRSLKIRFWRSLVTSAVVFLAIAFLVYMLSVESVNAMLEREIGEVIVKTAHAQRIWVAIISLLVAVVGITNTLHMSVAERYREIGTMKCLGALDRFVVELFLLEALAMGAIGASVGSLLGTILATTPWVFRIKELAEATLPWATLGQNFLIGCVVGLFLTVVGSLYPAYRASRMVPAEAMRTEV